MRKWISIFMVVVLAVATAVPYASHAMTHGTANSTHTQQASNGFDCHDHGGSKVALAQSDHDTPTKKPCCKKGMCKCIGGACGGLAKIFDNGSPSLFTITTSKSRFGFANEFADSSLPTLLKRPPRA